ncbi:hypothetical protein ABI125_13990 [Tamlana crocina]
MGIGRRSFLRLSSLALAGTMVDPLQAVNIKDNIYVNKKLGIIFEIPTDWGYISVKDFGKLKQEQILNDFYEEIKDEVYEDLGDPICIATKYYHDLPKYKGIFSPTITLNITHKSELEEFDFENFEELMEFSEIGVSNLLKDFRVLKRHEPFFQSNCKFYEYDAQYLFEHIELKKPLRVELKVLKVEHNDFYYDFNCHQSKEANQIAQIEFDNFKKTIRLI